MHDLWIFKDGTGGHERRPRGENASAVRIDVLLPTPAASCASPEVSGSSQIRIRLGWFMFEITEAGASTFLCLFFFFFLSEWIESKSAGPKCIQSIFDWFLFLIRWEGKVADIERRAQDTCLCPGILEGLLGPSNNYVHGSITIDSNGVGGRNNFFHRETRGALACMCLNAHYYWMLCTCLTVKPVYWHTHAYFTHSIFIFYPINCNKADKRDTSLPKYVFSLGKVPRMCLNATKMWVRAPEISSATAVR